MSVIETSRRTSLCFPNKKGFLLAEELTTLYPRGLSVPPQVTDAMTFPDSRCWEGTRCGRAGLRSPHEAPEDLLWAEKGYTWGCLEEREEIRGCSPALDSEERASERAYQENEAILKNQHLPKRREVSVLRPTPCMPSPLSPEEVPSSTRVTQRKWTSLPTPAARKWLPMRSCGGFAPMF